MQMLIVTLSVELDTQIIFHKWIPEDAQSIKFSENEVDVQFSFGIESVASSLARDRDAIGRLVNVGSYKVFVQANSNVSDTLAEYIKGDQKMPHPPEIGAEYETVARKIYGSVVSRLNRLIEYAYAVKGQYWLRPLKFDVANHSSFFQQTGANAFIGLNGPHRFRPNNMVFLAGEVQNVASFISEAEWPEVSKYVCEDSRPPIVNSLLSKSRELASEKHNRTALIEAVCALELRLYEFGQRYPHKALPPDLVNRVESNSVQGLIDAAGLRGSFALVIPLLVDDSTLPDETLALCRQAIEMRNNVVHHGQRNVDSLKLKKFQKAIEECCATLQQLIEEP